MFILCYNMNLILACDEKFGIGINNSLPSWNLKEDMIKFKNITTSRDHNAVIMGKNTYHSLREKSLPKRFNIVVSNSLFQKYCKNNNDKICKHNKFVFCRDMESSIDIAKSITSIWDDGEIWIIGGAILYEYVIKNYEINKLYLTRVHNNYQCNITLGPSTIKFIENTLWNEIEERDNYTFYYFNKNYR